MHPYGSDNGGLNWAQREVRRARRMHHGGLKEPQSRGGVSNEPSCLPIKGFAASNFRPNTYTSYRPHISMAGQSSGIGKVTAGALRAASVMNVVSFYTTLNEITAFNKAMETMIAELQGALLSGEAVDLIISKGAFGYEGMVIPVGADVLSNDASRVTVRSTKKSRPPKPKKPKQPIRVEREHTREFTLRESDFMRGEAREDRWMDRYDFGMDLKF